MHTDRAGLVKAVLPRQMSAALSPREGQVGTRVLNEMLLGAMLAVAPMGGLQAADGSIYTCIDALGRKLTSDRPIADCNTREQRVLNADGSVRRVVPPTPTADERAVAEARDQAAIAERSAALEAVRRDRNLMARFPNEAAHRRARKAALEDSRKSVQTSQSRLAALEKERKPLMAETEFYAGKALPATLKQQIEANDASANALRSLMDNQEAEIGRINERYDAELAQLRKLWSGTQASASRETPDHTQRKATK